MKKVSVEDLKKLQLEMVAYVDKVCRENQIDYSISAGTLLGALKYQGYIPWDDDIDIMLTRPNYEKLIAILLKETPENFSLLHYKQRETYLMMAKLYNNQTYFTSHKDTLNLGTGVFIDIFPIDSLPDDKVEGEKFKRQVQKAARNLFASHKGFSYASAEKKRYVIAKAILWLPYHLRYTGKSYLLAEKADKLMQKYNDKDYKYCNYVFALGKKTAYFDKELFTSYEDCEFENLTLKKIKNHDAYLTELYGQWRKPPKGKKHDHSQYIWYWKESKTQIK